MFETNLPVDRSKIDYTKLRDFLTKYWTYTAIIEETKKRLTKANNDAIEAMHYHIWMIATDRSPIRIEDDELVVCAGANIATVCRFISSWANLENHTVEVEFNGTMMVAKPGMTADQVYRKWEASREEPLGF